MSDFLNQITFLLLLHVRLLKSDHFLLLLHVRFLKSDHFYIHVCYFVLQWHTYVIGVTIVSHKYGY